MGRMTTRLSPAQLRALAAVDRRILRQYPDLLRRDGVRWNTLFSLVVARAGRPVLVRMIGLRPPGLQKADYAHFFVLSDAGAAVLRAHRRGGAKSCRATRSR